MATLEVFDRPLCCSTGICGPAVDPALVRFAADLDWLKSQGVEVRRYNLAFAPAEFTRHDDVREALHAGQLACLPLVRIDGRIVSQGGYPDRAKLAAWCGVDEDRDTAEAIAAQTGQASCCAPTRCS